ncbi:hypothetical protein [Actinomadura sp. CNU-125]|uniref:hypothetical protein n=1 Tax=Actinomadura sp. CNU-125 TaxID=1904961 RepID=UPI001177AAFC|nr:hypothetical protein [Actinomadura sp. CNU-125]
MTRRTFRRRAFLSSSARAWTRSGAAFGAGRGVGEVGGQSGRLVAGEVAVVEVRTDGAQLAQRAVQPGGGLLELEAEPFGYVGGDLERVRATAPGPGDGDQQQFDVHRVLANGAAQR